MIVVLRTLSTSPKSSMNTRFAPPFFPPPPRGGGIFSPTLPLQGGWGGVPGAISPFPPFFSPFFFTFPPPSFFFFFFLSPPRLTPLSPPPPPPHFPPVVSGFSWSHFFIWGKPDKTFFFSPPGHSTPPRGAGGATTDREAQKRVFMELFGDVDNVPEHQLHGATFEKTPRRGPTTPFSSSTAASGRVILRASTTPQPAPELVLQPAPLRPGPGRPLQGRQAAGPRARGHRGARLSA